MVSENENGLPRVVLMPDVFIRGIFSEPDRDVLLCWRDGRMKLVITRPLLVIYLQALDSMGASEELLGRWVKWLTSPEKTHFVVDHLSDAGSWWDLAIDAAQLGEADMIVVGESGAASQEASVGVRWVSAHELVQRV